MSVFSELEAVLKEEQKILLSGDFDSLEKLVKRKSKLAERLTQRKPEVSKAEYKYIADLASRNEALLKSARLGIEAAMKLIKQTPDAEDQKTYSKSGERKSLGKSSSSLIQKI